MKIKNKTIEEFEKFELIGVNYILGGFGNDGDPGPGDDDDDDDETTSTIIIFGIPIKLPKKLQ